jgi:hypothetical protein
MHAPMHATGLVSATFVALAALAAAASDGGPSDQAEPVLSGPALELSSPPLSSSASSSRGGGGGGTCSLHHPLCVDAASGTRVAPEALLGTLAAADRAWETLTKTLALPPPDGGTGGVWHLVLTDGVPGGGTAALESRDPLARFDRADSYGLVDRSIPAGCPLELAVARAVARGALWRSAPATDEGSARAQVEMLARLATACSPADADDSVFQSEPERTLVDPASATFDRGASLFFDWLDTRFGRQPGALVAGLWALAPTRTPPGAARWSAEPDAFDVLRVSLKDALWPGSTLDDVLVRFAVDRALTLSPAPRLAWRIPWPSAARRLASPVPPAPSGASYVLVSREGAHPAAKLRLEAQWEDYGRMRWAVVKLDSAGKALAQMVVPSLDRATRASMTLEGLEAAQNLLIVGVNVGSTEHPFHPAQGEWEPHGWLLTLEGE